MPTIIITLEPYPGAAAMTVSVVAADYGKRKLSSFARVYMLIIVLLLPLTPEKKGRRFSPFFSAHTGRVCELNRNNGPV